MRFYDWLPVYGDPTFRGDCPSEYADHKTAIGMIKDHYPDLIRIIIHPKNEGKRNGFQAALERAIGGLNKGASDIIIPGCPTFVCELKRRDHTAKSVKWQPGQLDYLKSCQDQGAFVCVALGWQGVIEAIEAWNKERSEWQKNTK